MSPDWVNIGAAIIFGLAVIHTFSVKFFERFAEKDGTHAGFWRFLAEVEVVFGIWALILALYLGIMVGADKSLHYLETRNFTEPMFVFVIMVVAASRPIIMLALSLVNGLARALPVRAPLATYFVTLTLVPLLGSFITEPAAMTLAAFLLHDKFYSQTLSPRLKYATIGVLFVNVSVGGTLTAYAAPPVLMVADTWGWDTLFMLEHFGWHAIVAVLFNALAATVLFRKELGSLTLPSSEQKRPPLALVGVHLLFLLGVVVFSHQPVIFMGLFLFFIGLVSAYPTHQEPLIIREGLLVGFFLAGLVVLGGQQQWWLQEALTRVDSTAVYYGAVAMTAITDNAALTYLGSLVSGLSPEFKHSLVSGAVTGGGLTVIANAPNPAGYSILKGHFDGKHISALGILLAAAGPTLVAILAFRLI